MYELYQFNEYSKDIQSVCCMILKSYGFLMKYFSCKKYEIILTDYEISRFARYEIKFAVNICVSKYFIRVSVFHVTK